MESKAEVLKNILKHSILFEQWNKPEAQPETVLVKFVIE